MISTRYNYKYTVLQAHDIITRYIVSFPPGIRGGMIFVSSTRQGGATAKLQEPGWGHIR